jgi:hypothetical protein
MPFRLVLDVVDPGLTVEFDDEVDDSRTGCKAKREPSDGGFDLSVVGLLRAGLDDLGFRVSPLVVAKTAGEYEDAVLGVGTWLKGESVYRVDGVAVEGTGVTVSRLG